MDRKVCRCSNNFSEQFLQRYWDLVTPDKAHEKPLVVSRRVSLQQQIVLNKN